MTVGLTAAMIEDEATLGALAPEWWRLWQRSDRATPFQSPGWLMAWWRAFSPGGLLTAAVRIGGRLAGLAPFYIERQGGRARILPIGISISDYLDVLIDPDMRGPVLASGMGDDGAAARRSRARDPCPQKLRDD